MNRKRFLKIISLVVATTFVISNSPSLSSLPPLIPREVLFGNPERIEPQLSPDGKFIAYLAPDQNGIMQIWIRSVGQQDGRVLTAEKQRGIKTYAWTYDGKHLIYQQDENGNENWHLYTVALDSKRVRDLTPHKGVRAELIALDPNFPNQILAGMNLKDFKKKDAYRIDLETGAAKLVSDLPSNTIEQVADRQFQIRAAKVATPDGGSLLMVKDTPQKPWKSILKWSADDTGNPISFAPDGKVLYIKDNQNANTVRLRALNLTTNKNVLIAQDSQYDLDRVLAHPVSGKVEAVGIYKDKLNWKVLDESLAADFATLAQTRRGQINVLSRDLSNKNWLVSYITDDGPEYFHLYNRDSKKSKLLFSSQPKLEQLSLAQTKPISYTARDGLTIHGYLTTPVGIPAKNLPTVLLVHGGPWLRDKWGYAPNVQWLANRGYAVLQVNYRGSEGYGRQFLNAGNKEWGRKMQNDLTDGVNWIVKEGIADPKKVAIMGRSYGGYATLAGLTFTPNLFAAGVSLSGPCNLLTLFKSLPPYWSPIKAMLYYRVGNPETQADLLRSRSPLFYVERIQAPLLIGQGANDPRVTQAESDQIVTAMEKENKPVKYVLYANEGHQLARPANNIHFYANAEEFLGKYLGGRVEPMGDIPGHSAKIQ